MTASTPYTDASIPPILACDVFGTVVDWHGSVMREIAARAPDIDAAAFARAWRAGYQPAMARVRAGELGWTRIDELNRMILDAVLPDFGLAAMDEASRVELNRVWHRLAPWPDAVAGLARLRSRFMLCTLSNGNIGLLADMAKRAGLPWDCILSAETFGAYKPDPRTYLGVAETFDVEPGQVMLVAAHQDDLDAARDCGLQTAYIERPEEFGADAPKPVAGDAANTLHARNLTDLADRLGCP